VTDPAPRCHSPAAERNAAPILAVLHRVLGPHGRMLEIASGSGQHAAHFAAALPAWTWQPSDTDAELLDSIAAWCAGLPNVNAPLALDVLAPVWPVEGPFDAIFCANMLHIAPWATCIALMRGAARHLTMQGLLITYGPYLDDERPTAPSNLAFDADLRRRDPAWGLRRLQEVTRQAVEAGLLLRERVEMPANNLTLVFGRRAA
jgi:SAM-dependent methyltransferase